MDNLTVHSFVDIGETHGVQPATIAFFFKQIRQRIGNFRFSEVIKTFLKCNKYVQILFSHSPSKLRKKAIIFMALAFGLSLKQFVVSLRFITSSIKKIAFLFICYFNQNWMAVNNGILPSRCTVM